MIISFLNASKYNLPSTAFGHFQMVAKALGRQGNAHRRLGELDRAKVAFEKALTEHRTPEYRTALSEVESLLKKAAEEAYVDPAIRYGHYQVLK